MSAFTIARGSTFATKTVAKKAGIPFPLVQGTRVLFVAKVNQTDPDSAAVALLDNVSLGGVVVLDPNATTSDPNCGVCKITMPGSSTYGLPDSVRQLWYEIWIHDVSGNPWQGESGSISLKGRALKQQP